MRRVHLRSPGRDAPAQRGGSPLGYKRLPTGDQCGTCFRLRLDHEVVLGDRVCDMVLVKDRPLSDGSGRTVVVEGFEEDLPRTRRNRLRWIRPDRTPWR